MTEPDYVLLNRAKKGARYHFPVYRSYSFKAVPACGADRRDMAEVDEQLVAVQRHKSKPCGKCWPGRVS